MSELQGIWVIAECTADGRLDEGTEEALTAARSLTGHFSEPVTVTLWTGEGDSSTLETRLAQLGADRIIVLRSPRLAGYQPEALLAAISSLIQERRPRVVLLSSSSTSSDIAPRLSLRTKGTLVTQALEINVDASGVLSITRSCYAESMLSTVTAKPDEGPQFVTLKKRAFAKAVPNESRSATVETITPDLSAVPTRLQLLNVQQSESRNVQKLEEADIVVSGGRGLKEPENFRLVEELASALGAAVGASRAIVDAGWRPHSEQVGQTGKTVRPKVYFALGISGALQHQVGMNASQIIIAINRDEQAPIFKLADFGIVGDVTVIAPALTRAIQERRLVKA